MSREEARERYAKLVVRLQDEIDQMLKVFNHMREAYENELNEGMGYKRLGMNESMVKKGKELAAMLNTIVDAKIRYDKAAKHLADNMTPEEERKAATIYVKSLPADERGSWMANIRKWMLQQGEPVVTTHSDS
jgi:uncharacterized protein YdiU (UPF0061 family)